MELTAIKMLGIDMINKANSGHSGIAIGAAPILYALYRDHLNIDHENEHWVNRDRFVLSAGHGSALLYATLHAFGFPYSMNDLKQFRQLGSKTPGHPEIELPFVETTTGPLGQGLTNAVGMAIAEQYLRATIGKIINHHIYVVSGDGCLQEGQSYEAMSLAGKLKLNKLILLHDSNNVQIDSYVKQTNEENLRMRMKAMNWNYILVTKGDDVKVISKAIAEAKTSQDKPTFIEIRTIIGKDSAWENTPKVHGKAIGKENRDLLAAKLGWIYKEFEYPSTIFNKIRNKLKKRSKKAINFFNAKFKKLSAKQKEIYNNIFLSQEWNNFDLKVIEGNTSTRLLTKELLKQLANKVSLLGGSADVAGSTFVQGSNGDYNKENPAGRNILFGVREHAMAGIANGIATYQGMKPITATFLAFADFEKPALRLACLMKLPILAFFSHDSLFVGEDGPTHQPIEQIALLRGIPGMTMFRPCNSQELNSAFRWYINNSRPTAIVTTRQNLSNTHISTKHIYKGGYIFHKESGEHKLTLLASGSEVDLLYQILMEMKTTTVRLVSVPSLCLLKRQKERYLNRLVPKDVKQIVYEATSDSSWLTLFPNAKLNVLSQFGASGKGIEVYQKYGFNKKAIIHDLKKYW